MSAKSLVFIDRIEGKQAVIVPDGVKTSFNVPVSLLPPGAAEGQWYRLGWERDKAKEGEVTAAIQAARGRLTKGDDGGDFSL